MSLDKLFKPEYVSCNSKCIILHTMCDTALKMKVKSCSVTVLEVYAVPFLYSHRRLHRQCKHFI